MMSALTAQPTHSAVEFLALERSASFRSEFHDGQIYAITSTSREHNLIALNIAGV
jgi:Uma2 family endonuclease